MFNATQSGLSSNLAGAVSADDLDLNATQVAGGVLLIGTVGACAIGGMIVAPVPVGGLLGLGTGLVMFGPKLQGTEDKSDSKSDKSAKSEATAEAPAKPAPGTAVTV